MFPQLLAVLWVLAMLVRRMKEVCGAMQVMALGRALVLLSWISNDQPN
jgi:hypothetical protein